MPNSYGYLLYHIIFTTKNREHSIEPEMEQPLYAYIASLVRANGGEIYAIGGTSNHVHLFVRFPRHVSVSRMLCIIKANSSRWIKEAFPDREGFSWQDGYGAFTVGRTEFTMIRNYVLNQKEHHRQESLEEEWKRLTGE